MLELGAGTRLEVFFLGWPALCIGHLGSLYLPGFCGFCGSSQGFTTWAGSAVSHSCNYPSLLKEVVSMWTLEDQGMDTHSPWNCVFLLKLGLYSGRSWQLFPEAAGPLMQVWERICEAGSPAHKSSPATRLWMWSYASSRLLTWDIRWAPESHLIDQCCWLLRWGLFGIACRSHPYWGTWAGSVVSFLEVGSLKCVCSIYLFVVLGLGPRADISAMSAQRGKWCLGTTVKTVLMWRQQDYVLTWWEPGDTGLQVPCIADLCNTIIKGSGVWGTPTHPPWQLFIENS